MRFPFLSSKPDEPPAPELGTVAKIDEPVQSPRDSEVSTAGAVVCRTCGCFVDKTRAREVAVRRSSSGSANSTHIVREYACAIHAPAYDFMDSTRIDAVYYWCYWVQSDINGAPLGYTKKPKEAK